MPRGDFEDDFDPEDLDPEELLEEAQEPVVRPAYSFLSARPSRKAFWPGVVFSLAAAAVSVAAWNDSALKVAWIGNPQKIFSNGEWWRLFTSMLLHSDMEHLLSNLLFLIPFGGLLTNYFGWRVFPWLGLALGMATQALSLKTYPAGSNLLGASGLLYVLFGLWLSLYFRAETRLKWTNKFMRIVGFGLVMFIPSQFQSNVSYRTHYIGLGVGLAAGALYGVFALKKPGVPPSPPRPKVLPRPGGTLQ
jgi:membrane associated rhomboid family serine protease